MDPERTGEVKQADVNLKTWEDMERQRSQKEGEKFRLLVESKQQIDSQINEILMAKEEVELLEDDAVVYKLIGPLMVQQELKEVKINIKGRLAYLDDRMVYYDKEIGSTVARRKAEQGSK